MKYICDKQKIRVFVKARRYELKEIDDNNCLLFENEAQVNFSCKISDLEIEPNVLVDFLHHISCARYEVVTGSTGDKILFNIEYKFYLLAPKIIQDMGFNEEQARLITCRAYNQTINESKASQVESMFDLAKFIKRVLVS